MTRIAIALAAALTACGGGEPKTGTGVDAPTALVDGSGVACTGATFDPCTAATQCMSMNCHLFNQQALQVCVATCTPGDNTTCPVDRTGAHGTCNNNGICKPAAANDCSR